MASSSSGVPPGSALGLVETLGLVASIEAADAMLKAADVRLVRKHRVDPGRISHVVVGETSAVQAAVDAGTAAAARLGKVYGSLVISRPSDDVWRAMLGVTLDGDDVPEEDAPVEDASDDDAPAGEETVAVDSDVDVPATAPPDHDYDAMLVRDLRTLVRDRDGIEMSGRDVSRASKDDLVAELRAADAR